MHNVWLVTVRIRHMGQCEECSMRDLSVQELGFVYGAGCSPCPPTKKPKSGRGSNGSRGKNTNKGKGKGSGSGSRGKGSCG